MSETQSDSDIYGRNLEGTLSESTSPSLPSSHSTGSSSTPTDTVAHLSLPGPEASRPEDHSPSLPSSLISHSEEHREGRDARERSDDEGRDEEVEMSESLTSSEGRDAQPLSSGPSFESHRVDTMTTSTAIVVKDTLDPMEEDADAILEIGRASCRERV